jgi:hypothetical protein
VLITELVLDWCFPLPAGAVERPSAVAVASSGSSPLCGLADPEARRADTPAVGFRTTVGRVPRAGAGTTGLRRSGEAVTTAMVLNLALLGSVWLTGLTAVHCVPPQPLRRCRCALRAAAQAAVHKANANATAGLPKAAPQ